jgi:hypothetical protein
MLAAFRLAGLSALISTMLRAALARNSRAQIAKISLGAFSAVFFLQCLKPIGWARSGQSA